MALPLFVLAVIAGLMLAELRVSLRNEGQLRALGAIQPSGDVYRVMSVLYPVVFIVMGLEGAYRAWVSGPGAGPGMFFVSGVLLFVASKGLKYWAIGSLGVRWSFRVFVVPGLPLVTCGPYRYIAHPNYVAIVGELVGAAMMMNAVVTGPIGVLTFGLTLLARIRFEDRVLAAYRARQS
jgi:methyltransferase